VQKRHLGKNGPWVSEIGLGCMGMSYAYGPADEGESLRVLHRYLELGGNFLDTAEIYGPLKNEELVGKFLKQVKRESVVVATKFGFKYGGGKISGTDSSPENVRKACEGSLKRLGIETIDLFYQHRVDANVPIEETIGAMADLVRQGKVKLLGMSEANPETLKRAAKVHPIAALQSEYSLWFREPEQEVIPTLAELGIGFVPYSPLGRGFLTGKIDASTTFEKSDFRSSLPRFTPDAMKANQAVIDLLNRIAKQKNATPAQIALAWLLAQKPWVVPIPGTTKLHRLEENIGAANVELTGADLRNIETAIADIEVKGARYPAHLQARVGL